MKISVFGLGYVGTVAAACLARDGHDVIGIDPNKTKVDLINSGKSPIIEADIDDLIAAAVEAGRLVATGDAGEGIRESELSLVCVGTPSKANGSLDTQYVRRVCEQIGKQLGGLGRRHTVVIRSTLLPGSMREVVLPALEASSGLRAGSDFGLCNNPEFLREGTAVYDYDNPPKTVVGEIDTESGDLLMKIYDHLSAPVVRTSVEAAEMVKYVDNVWHALKICFANEIGNISKTLGLDGTEIMGIFCQDEKLNISPTYLRPGFAFGGSCLPKDVRALTYKARRLDIEVPVLNTILASNELQVGKALRLILDKPCKRIGVLGFSFKAGTDDLRESPVVDLIESLIGKGYDVRLYDRNVQIAFLVGANREYILERLPHLARLMTADPRDLVEHAELVVIGNNDPGFESLLAGLAGERHIIDLAGACRSLAATHSNYEGLCW